MQILPDQKNARSTAVLLLLIAVIIVYLLLFHWFILKHWDYAAELTDMREQLARFEEVLSFYERRSLPRPERHMANSAAMLRMPESLIGEWQRLPAYSFL